MILRLKKETSASDSARAAMLGLLTPDKTKMVWIGEYVLRLLFVSGQERTSVRGTMEAHRFDNDARYAGIKIQNPLG